MLQFFLLGKLEYLSTDCKLVINFVLSKAEIDNVEKAFIIVRVSLILMLDL